MANDASSAPPTDDDAPPAKRQALTPDASTPHEIEELRTSERRAQLELARQRRRESTLILRVALMEKEAKALRTQMSELRGAMHPDHEQVSKLLLDPAVNAEITRLRAQVKEAERREGEAQQELEASQFQAGSIAGKKLIEKCRELQEENEQLGQDLAEGAVQQLRARAALEAEHAAELRKALAETREWVEQLHEELDVAQAQILALKADARARRG